MSPELERYMIMRANFHAHRIARTIPRCNCIEDLAQAIIFKILVRYKGYDPSRSAPKTFISRAAKYSALTILNELSSKGINSPVANAAELTADDERARPIRPAQAGPVVSSESDLADLRADVKSIAKKTSPKNQRIIRKLLAGASVTQIAADTGVSPTTVLRRIKALKNDFAAYSDFHAK